MKFKEFDKPEYFVNRELSWIKFDDRVLSEARDKNLPLFERLKFLSITSSNLDEFYMVRVASLKDQVHAGYKKTDIAGMTAKEQLKAISRQTHDLVHVQYSGKINLFFSFFSIFFGKKCSDIQRFITDQRKRSGRIHCHWCQDRIYIVFKILIHKFFLLLGKCLVL